MLMICNVRELITYLQTKLAFMEQQCRTCPELTYSAGWAYGSAHAYRETIEGLQALTPQGVTTISGDSENNPERK